MSNIPISGLNSLNLITSDDFFPIVDSGSLTTFKTTMLTVANYMSSSGTASYALRAGSSSMAVTSSFAGTASSAASASFLTFPNTSTASYSSYATSASAAISASYARNATNSASSSFSLIAISSSYATQSSHADRATTSSFSITSSLSFFSVSSSYAQTASFISSSLIATLANRLNNWVILSETYPQNTLGQNNATGVTRTLNTIDYNSGSLVSVNTSSGQVTILISGIYRIRGTGAVSSGPTGFVSRLNVKIGSNVRLFGFSSENGPTVNNPSNQPLTYHQNIWDEVIGVLTLNASDVLTLHHSCSIPSLSVTFGVPCSLGGRETYSTLEMEKLN